MKQLKLNESLYHGDLKNFVNEVFTVDRYSSKMGEDKDIIVLGFNIKEKHPALDLMEFIEKSYNFILDADISSGEEHDGHYQVFVEIERTPEFPNQLKSLMKGVGNLCDRTDWRFRYQKAPSSVELNDNTVLEHIPMTKEAYDAKMLEIKTADVKEFFDQGSIDVALESDNTITFKRPYAGDVKAKFVSIGSYDTVKKTLPGPIDLSESGQSQVLFLNKYIGNYDINKIGNKFLIRNGKQAVVIEKETW